MGATEQDTRFPRRRFITRHDVEDAAAAGVLTLSGRDVITHEAAQRARDLGVQIVREGDLRAAVPSTGAQPASPGGPSGESTDALRRAVRAAVVAELGSVPANLDAAIDRVLNRRVT
jgi:hypothetical protein